jgi:putative ABC transport system permease protein
MLLAADGGIAGVTLGWVITAIVSRSNGWLTDIPGEVLVAGVGATVAIGAVAGVVPAVRAARTPPTAALNS